jgi:hypothetical protein
MKTVLSKINLPAGIAGILILGILVVLTCCNNNDTQNGLTGPQNGSQTKMQKSISNTNFSLWGTCSTLPYVITGTTGICVPVGGTSCSTNYVGAQQSSGQNATGMQFVGCFKGGSNAPDGSNEMAVFVTDDVTNWTGHEMGFVETLNDHTLKAYIQGGGNYVWQTISTGDDGYHTYKCQCRDASHTYMVDFYVDGTYKCTLQNSGSSYWNNYDYWVGTTHRTSNSWSSTGQQIEMYTMTTY